MAQIHCGKSAALFCACLASAVFAAPSARAGGPYDAEYVFGDSLSDNGNAAEYAAAIAGTGFPYPPSYHDAYTNGPVAVALLAQSLGIDLEPSLWRNGFSDANNIFPPGFVPGTNYAYAGATAEPNGIIVPGANLPDQVLAYTNHANVADPSALYVIEIGGNDVILKTLGAPVSIDGSVMEETSEITTLAQDGARNFLIVNVPNVGLIPLVSSNAAESTAATTYSQEYDSELNSQLAGLVLPTGAALHEFDLYDFNTAILANAAAYGFTNTTEPCYSNTPYSAASATGCDLTNVDSFLYWDDVHPTAPVHALWAQGMEAALVPEPSTWAMLLLGFAGTGLMALRGARKGRAA